LPPSQPPHPPPLYRGCILHISNLVVVVELAINPHGVALIVVLLCLLNLVVRG
jgi:hypothetical protein